ncbi:MAG: ATP-binding cassette domain-containing protein, partial [Spirochaetia bacterium]|nr:ATP-binding cassette domain-containing protein [Spirochaetia bacterium]
MSSVYSLQNVSKSLGGKAILRSLTLDIPEGRITSLVGPSGSGKSTLLRMLNRLTDADEGTILYR